MVKGCLTIRKRQPKARQKINSVKRRPNILALPALEVKRKSREKNRRAHDKKGGFMKNSRIPGHLV